MTEPTARERAEVVTRRFSIAGLVPGSRTAEDVTTAIEQAILAAETAVREEPAFVDVQRVVPRISELESQVAALRSELEEHGHCLYDEGNGSRCSCCNEERPHHAAGCEYILLMHDTAATAAAYTQRIREKALEEAASVVLCTDLPNECVHLDAEGSSFGVIASERMFYAQIIGALATPPATEEAK